MKRYSKKIKKGTIYLLITIVIISGLFYLFGFAPLIKDISTYKQKIAEVNRKTNEIQMQSSMLTSISEGEKKEIEEEAKRIGELIPDEPDLTGLLSLLASEARLCGINLISFDYSLRPGSSSVQPAPRKPRTPSSTSIPEAKYNRIEFRANIKCTYQSLVDFVYRLQNLDRLINIQELSIIRDLPLLTVRMQIEAYYKEKKED